MHDTNRPLTSSDLLSPPQSSASTDNDQIQENLQIPPIGSDAFAQLADTITKKAIEGIISHPLIQKYLSTQVSQQSSLS